jgi:hypothetical protein
MPCLVVFSEISPADGSNENRCRYPAQNIKRLFHAKAPEEVATRN